MILKPVNLIKSSLLIHLAEFQLIKLTPKCFFFCDDWQMHHIPVNILLLINNKLIVI